MPRYYLHIRTGNSVDRDKVGVECNSLSEARAFASQAVIRHVNDSPDLDLDVVASSCFEIANEDGRKELALPFTDILPEAKKS
jgi:hypothetical protein